MLEWKKYFVFSEPSLQMKNVNVSTQKSDRSISEYFQDTTYDVSVNEWYDHHVLKFREEIKTKVTKTTDRGNLFKPYRQYEKNRKKRIERVVFLVDVDGNPLTPTNPVLANIMLQKGEAVVLRKGTPYVLQLTKRLEKSFISPVRIEVEVKEGTTVKVSTILRKAKFTTIFPYYMPIHAWTKNPNPSTREIATHAVTFIKEIMKYSVTSQIDIVYEEPVSYNLLNAIHSMLIDDVVPPVTRRGFLELSTWKKRQKQMKQYQLAQHRVAELFFGYYSNFSQSELGVNDKPEWFVRFCSSFVYNVYNPFIEHISRNQRLPDEYRWRSSNKRIAEVMSRFYVMLNKGNELRQNDNIVGVFEKCKRILAPRKYKSTFSYGASIL